MFSRDSEKKKEKVTIKDFMCFLTKHTILTCFLFYLHLLEASLIVKPYCFMYNSDFKFEKVSALTSSVFLLFFLLFFLFSLMSLSRLFHS